MIPTSESFGRIIDCRSLALEAQFYCLDSAKALNLMETWYSYVNDLFANSSVIKWAVQGKAWNEEKVKSSIEIPKHDILHAEFYGDTKNAIVYNKSSLRAYEKRLTYDPVFSLGIVPVNASIDYPDYAREHFDSSSPERLRESLIALFSLEGRINRRQWFSHDISGDYSCSEMIEKPGLYDGNLSILISCFSAAEQLEGFSESLQHFSEELSLQFTFINASVGIRQSQIGFEYKQYFGSLRNLESRSPDEFRIHQNAQYLYLQNVGWANTVSPIPSMLLTGKNSGDCYDICQLSNGALVVKSKSSISTTTLATLKRLKKALYPSLYPGKAVFQNTWPYFRSLWQNIPVLDEEIEVSESQVVFRHCKGVNTEYLLSL